MSQHLDRLSLTSTLGPLRESLTHLDIRVSVNLFLRGL